MASILIEVEDQMDLLLQFILNSSIGTLLHQWKKVSSGFVHL